MNMSEIGKRFKDINSYNSDMRKSMGDKLYFLEHLPDSPFLFVDFGCADGSMINELCTIFRNYEHQVQFIGYDCSSEMISLAKSKFYGEASDEVVFTSSWDEVSERLKTNKVGGKSVIILSSVIHEAYSYSKGQDDIDEFWKRVLGSDFDYIVVRDMMLDPGLDKVYSSVYDRVQISNSKLVEKYQQEQFANRWGTILTKKNLIHFLLKYRWKVNWDRELNENYFPIDTTEFYNKVKSSGNYDLSYWERFRVPFLDECFKRDFNIELDKDTHLKAIFKKHEKADISDSGASVI